MKALTPRQAETLRLLRQHVDLFGAPADAPWVGRQLGISRVSAWEHIKALERKGFVRAIGGGTSRRYIPINTCPTCGHELTQGGSHE